VLESVHSNDVEDHAVVIDQEGRSQRRLPLGSEPTRAASLPDSGYAKSGTTLFDAMH
jgi:hypothetical protein